MATGEVVGSVFLAADELLGVEELAVSAGPHFINDGGLKINKHSPRDVLSCAGLAEKGVESIVTSTDSLITWHLAIRLQKERGDLEAEERIIGERDLGI